MKLTALFLLAAACGSVTDDSSETTGPDGGMTETPVDPMILSIVPRAVLDERADSIAFSTGEPVHTHTGPTVMLGAAGCPDLARYAYLLDRHPPFGKDDKPNPLGFTVALPETMIPGSAQYRIDIGGDELTEWTAIPGAPGERAQVTLTRDDIPALGTYDGAMRIEVRAKVTGGADQTAEACWTHHPLAAPLSVQAPIGASGPTSLDGRVLASNALAIDILANDGIRDADAYTVQIVQQTAEPIALAVAVPAPSGTYATTVVDTYSATSSSTLAKNCDVDEAYCDVSALPDPPDVMRAGSLATGRWRIRLVDEATGRLLDCPGNTCPIAARAPGAAARTFRVVLSLADVRDLWPVATTPAEITVGGHAIVGGWLAAKQIRCRMLKTVGDTTACISWSEYTEVHALDRARLELAAFPIHIATGRGGSTITAAVGYLAGSAVTAPSRTWDGGDGPL